MSVRRLVASMRRRRWAHVFMAILRILLGFAVLPAGLKKVIGEPFTDPSKVGPFHEFLHAFHATGGLYRFVGAVQITVALLLMTQRYGSLGAALALPVFGVICVFCWSTQVYFTAVMVSLMLGGVLLLLLWDIERWRRVFGNDLSPPMPEPTPRLIDLALWGRCGLAIFLLYLLIVAASGGVYRPKGIEWDNPAFYTLPLIALFPLATLLIERRRRRSRLSAGATGSAAPARSSDGAT